MKQLMIWTLLAVLTAGQGADRAEVQLQAAIKMETFDGDLKGAIEVYKKLASGSNRAVAAKALVRLGQCYEKMGDAEARKAYERVIRDFADQKDAVAEAQKCLAANTVQPENSIEVERVAAYPDKREYFGLPVYEGQSISRDGRYLVFSKNDGIYMQDLAKNTERRIVPKTSQQDRFDAIIFPDGRQIVYERIVGPDPVERRGEVYVIGVDGSNPRLLIGGLQNEPLLLSAISPDGRQLAYFLGKMEDGIQGDLYVIGTDGSNPRLIAKGEKNEILIAKVWSPDGKHLLVWAIRVDPVGNSRLILVSVAEGSSRVIGPRTGFGQFSPDGRYVSFCRWPVISSDFQSGLCLVPTEGGKEVLLTGGDVSDPRWTPDGKRIFFRNQRPDQYDPRQSNRYLAREPFDMYSMRVADGKPEGKPELMKKDLAWPGMLLGTTQDGNLFYSHTADESFNIYVVDLDPATGKAVSKPERLNRTFVNKSGGPPMWSPDGRLLAYAKPQETDSPKTLLIRSVDKGEERPLTISPPFNSASYVDLQQWFPDNQSLLVVDQVEGRFVFRKVDAQTGKQQLFFERPGNEAIFSQTALSLDGKVLFFSLCKAGARQSSDSKVTGPNTLRLMRRNLESGEEREIYLGQSPMTGFRALTLSSDGRQIAFTKSNTDNTASLLTLPIEGGEARELYRSDLLLATRGWTKDMRHILVAQSDPGSGMQEIWSVPTEGGKPIPAGLAFPVIGGASVNPDGRRFTFVGRQPGQTELWVMKLLPPGTKPSR